MSIYTRTGDSGFTSLASGKRVKKDNPRIDLCGEIDEFNSHLGYLNYLLSREKTGHEVISNIRWIQSILFDIGAEVAGFDQASIDNNDIIHIEKSIDKIEGQLPKLTNFILPGGCEAASHTHICRAVCRRVERKIVKINVKREIIRKEILIFFNRLSDYLFVLARYLNLLNGKEDVKWEKQDKNETLQKQGSV
ncbi:MAG: cob(I)yrinic acid a,c-diamide adenosyltransferase [Candidatus Dojkabacteria bacterium]|nr:cob(I)yrinic acid a,c-diamide adenosyltransferase [Candidatus Dojkabacteria bacterium]